MRIIFFLAAFLMAFSIAPPAHAARITGAYLMQLCDKNGKGEEVLPGGHVACQAYIAGVLDYHSILQSLKLAPDLNICVPDKVTLNDMHDIVLDYLKRNSQHDGFVASPAVTMALYQVYPCRKKK